jgi:hypothetical protein
MKLMKVHQELSNIPDDDLDAIPKKQQLKKFFDKLYRKTINVTEMVPKIDEELERYKKQESLDKKKEEEEIITGQKKI